MDMERGEERVRCMERVTWKPVLPYLKYIASGNLLLCLRELKQGLCINLEGWKGSEMGGRFKRKEMYVYLWLIHVEV